ncbi:MAG: DNA glycosylase [Clostridia bacterium]
MKINKDSEEIKIKTNCFNLKYTLECGQCFRWQSVENVDNEYVGVIKDRVVKIRQVGDNIVVSSNVLENLEDVIINYFDIACDYKKVEKEISEIDEHIKKAVKNTTGIHILKQDFLEVLISYIISANNNIPRISKSVKEISKNYGTKIIFENQEYYLFPTLEELKNVSEGEFRKCGVGFRARYIKNTIKDIIEKKVDVNNIESMTTNKLKKELLTLQGVGPKVADCILLFACGKKEVFPIDVWVERIMQLLYFKDVKTTLKKSQIIEIADKKFGENAGIVQQHLFYNIREKKMQIE